MACFGCNCLEVLNWENLPALVMSTRGYQSLTADQVEVMKKHWPGGIHHVDINTLEDVGGGSVRCCIAELFV